MTNREQSVIDDIDALVDEQMAGGEPIGGFDYYDLGFPRCPHCRRHWHGLAITTRIEEMAAREVMDEDYRYSEDDSTILCSGSEFIGPVATPEQLHWMRLDDDTKRRFPHGYIPSVNEMILAAMQMADLVGDLTAAAPYSLPELEFPDHSWRNAQDIPDWFRATLTRQENQPARQYLLPYLLPGPTRGVIQQVLRRNIMRSHPWLEWSVNDGDRVAFNGSNGFRYEGIARIEHRGLATTIHLDELEESTSARNEGIRGYRLDHLIWDETVPETQQQRALPRPSSEPPMWANNPTRTRRTRNRSSITRTPRV